jgi:U3 small nucleolar RNA-associated protein 25
MENADFTTTKLLTLLNVSAVKIGKRKRTFETSDPVVKLNKKRSVKFAPVDDVARDDVTIDDAPKTTPKQNVTEVEADIDEDDNKGV